MGVKSKVDNLLKLIKESDIDYEEKIQRLSESNRLYDLHEMDEGYFYFLRDDYLKESFPTISRPIFHKDIVILGFEFLSKNVLNVYVSEGINVSVFSLSDHVKWRRKYYLQTILQ